MLNKPKNPEELIKKCELIESLGFTIEHEDSRVSFNGYEFDFSAVAADSKSIIYTALKQMYNHGMTDGEENIKHNMKRLLGIE